VYAHLYIEDKQVGGMPTWEEVYEWVLEKENEYNKLKVI
jgi:hypothetical protein